MITLIPKKSTKTEATTVIDELIILYSDILELAKEVKAYILVFGNAAAVSPDMVSHDDIDRIREHKDSIRRVYAFYANMRLKVACNLRLRIEVHNNNLPTAPDLDFSEDDGIL